MRSLRSSHLPTDHVTLDSKALHTGGQPVNLDLDAAGCGGSGPERGRSRGERPSGVPPSRLREGFKLRRGVQYPDT